MSKGRTEVRPFFFASERPGQWSPFPPLWRLHGCNSQTIKIWAEDTIVFNTLSGHSHVLNTLAGEILLRLLDRPASRETIADELSATLEAPVDDKLQAALDNALAELDALGLVTCRPL